MAIIITIMVLELKVPHGDTLGTLAPVFYLFAILLTFVASWAAQLVFVLVALLWLVPDRRIEHVLKHDA